ncbi:MAG TPA: hypothetical protein VJ694_04485 [Patescibacteria group bacterium]|nr:hypothetical protein [Patescibacteria group bacterium]
MRRLPIIAALVLFLAVAVQYGRPVDGVWNSPDETANAFWAARVAAGEPLKVVDVFVGYGEGAVHPRSMAVAGDALVPGSFPGIILLYGVLKFLFKLPFYLYTPILTAVAALCLAALVSKLFDRRTGTWTAALFLVHPAVLYYGARGMFHNVLFIDALVLAASCFALRPLSRFFGARATADDAFGGFILAWALVVRTSEAVWVIPAFAAFLPLAGKDRWRRLAAAAAGGLVPLFVFMRVNATLYGSPWRTAYARPAPVAQTEIAAPPSGAALEAAPKALLPFGVHPALVARNVWNYGLKIFWWQSILAAFGFAWWAARIRKSTSPQRTYALMALLASAWLATLYGSWFVRDRLDPGAVTIGTSYVRYFLPAYVAALPFAAFALVRLGELARKPRLIALAVVLCAILGARAAVFAGDESLMAVRRTLEGNVVKKSALLALIEDDAVVMTERFDKLLVPERLRIIPATDPGAFEAAARLADFVPVYWYGLRPEGVEADRLASLAEASGLSWYEVAEPAPGEALYLLTPYWDEADAEMMDTQDE